MEEDVEDLFWFRGKGVSWLISNVCFGFGEEKVLSIVIFFLVRGY